MEIPAQDRRKQEETQVSWQSKVIEQLSQSSRLTPSEAVKKQTRLVHGYILYLHVNHSIKVINTYNSTW